MLRLELGPQQKYIYFVAWLVQNKRTPTEKQKKRANSGEASWRGSRIKQKPPPHERPPPPHPGPSELHGSSEPEALDAEEALRADGALDTDPGGVGIPEIPSDQKIPLQLVATGFRATRTYFRLLFRPGRNEKMWPVVESIPFKNQAKKKKNNTCS